MSYYRQSPDMNMYDRGSANMLGKVLIFVFIAIVLTGVAVLGFADALQDAARMRQMDSQTRHQEALWAAAAPYEEAKAQAQASLDIATTDAASIRTRAEADAASARTRAEAQAYADKKALEAYEAGVRAQQVLEREALMGQIAIYAGALLILVLILALGFAAFRLVARLIPMPAPQPATTVRPTAPQPVRQPALAPAQPVRSPTPSMPRPIYLSVESEAFRPAPRPKQRPTDRSPKGNRPPQGHITGQLIPVHGFAQSL